MTTKTKLSILAALVGATGLSFGGYKSTHEVIVSGSSATYYISGQGNLTDVRNSTDNVQYLGCEVSTAQNGQGNPTVYCIARNALGQYATCYATQPSPAMLDAVNAITPHSTIYFNAAVQSGVCTQIKVSNMSHAGGMQ